MMDHRLSAVQPMDEDAALRSILEGTAAETGDRFFAALVKSLARVLDAAGAWVTEYLKDASRLRALSFWFEDRYISNYEYDIAGTPCEPVIEEACLIHYPDKIVELFPSDPDLKEHRAVSYMGVPLLDIDGGILGHLAVLDVKPMLREHRAEALFRIFASRAAAELQRLRAESEIRESEEKLSGLLNSAMDAIIELGSRLTVTRVNSSALRTFGCASGQMEGRDVGDFLVPESRKKLASLAGELEARPQGQRYLWIPGGLKAVRAGGGEFPAEASLARFEVHRKSFYTLILRNIHDQVAAERKIESLASESEYLKEEIEELLNFKEIIGQSRPMLDVLKSVRQVASTDTAVLLYGETGTGKEVVARALHAAGSRAHKPLIKVNCAAIPPSLVESEFFGHEKGAFTGATHKREGRFALAHDGTIFLDEIGELPVDLQPKLLRVLQEGEFEPVGSSRTRKVDVRVIAATNRDLRQAMNDGRFREDLYYRLSVFPITIPPLRERGKDLELLAEAFAQKYSRKIGRAIKPLSRQCIRRLQAYHWPGNVRELQNVIERAVITARDETLNLDVALSSPGDSGRTPQPEPSPATSEGIRTARELQELERENLIRALQGSGWRVSGPNGAAELLGMPASTLNSRMKALGIKRPR